MTAAALPLTISEAAFQTTVIDLARRLGWRVSHQRPAQVRPCERVHRAAYMRAQRAKARATR